MELERFLHVMLGIKDGFVIVELEKKTSPEKITKVYLEYHETCCIIDGISYPVFDYTRETQWEHITWFEHKCNLIARFPRYKDHNGRLRTKIPKFSPPGWCYAIFLELPFFNGYKRYKS